jgi:hypothetical protein
VILGKPTRSVKTTTQDAAISEMADDRTGGTMRPFPFCPQGSQKASAFIFEANSAMSGVRGGPMALGSEWWGGGVLVSSCLLPVVPPGRVGSDGATQSAIGQDGRRDAGSGDGTAAR